MTPGASRRVLLVEDNDDNRRTLRVLLELWGFVVEEAEDGLAGVDKALSWDPDVAVVDISMPRLDGYGVARRLRDAPGGRPRLIALTALGSPADRERAFSSGFDFHVQKPADPTLLRRLLDDAASA